MKIKFLFAGILTALVLMFSGCSDSSDSDTSINVVNNPSLVKKVIVSFNSRYIGCSYFPSGNLNVESGSTLTSSDFPIYFSCVDSEVVPEGWSLNGVFKTTAEQYKLTFEEASQAGMLTIATVTLKTRKTKTPVVKYDKEKFLVLSGRLINEKKVEDGGTVKEGDYITVYPLFRDKIVDKYFFNNMEIDTGVGGSSKSNAISAGMISENNEINITAKTHDAVMAKFTYPESLYATITQNDYAVNSGTGSCLRKTSTIKGKTTCQLYVGEAVHFMNTLDDRTSSNLVINGIAVKNSGGTIFINDNGVLFMKLTADDGSRVEKEAVDGVFNITLK